MRFSRRITHKNGLGLLGHLDGYQIFYLRGSPYEMGFTLGALVPEQVTEACTTYVTHMPIQFLSDSFDRYLREKSPLIASILYRTVLEMINEILVVDCWEHFQAHHKASSPFLEEMRGLVDGVASRMTLSRVTLERLVSVNYGMDYLMSEVMSGRLMARLARQRATWPPALRKFDVRKLFTLPDMCNSACVGSLLLRDFQFMNAYVFHRYCSIVIRRPQDPQRFLHATVTLPGMIGGVTSLNSAGLACGMNMVRSAAATPTNIGHSVMMQMRDMAETCRNPDDVAAYLRRVTRGCPWILYCNNASGQARVFECIPASADNAQLRQPLHPPPWPQAAELAVWDQPNAQGVFVRDGEPVRADDAERWSRGLLPPDLTLPERWAPSGRLFDDWQDEQKALPIITNRFFPPWRPHPGVVVAANAFLNPLLRQTQINATTSFLDVYSIANQYRYDTLAAHIRTAVAEQDVTLRRCQDIIEFLSPWKRPTYPSNLMPSPIMMQGALSVVDCQKRILSFKYGYWDRPWCQIHLDDFLAL